MIAPYLEPFEVQDSDFEVIQLSVTRACYSIWLAFAGGCSYLGSRPSIDLKEPRIGANEGTAVEAVTPSRKRA